MDLLVPDWPAPAGVRALHTTRAGGVSAAPYDSLNLGDHVGDAPQAVVRNRQLLARQTGGVPVFLQQVHGAAVVPLSPQGSAEPLQADASWTSRTGVACTILVADCLPVLFCDREGRAVAAAHAGWRGLAGGVLEATVAALRAALPHGAELLAWLGPCIGPAAFEVGEEVKAAFEAGHAEAVRHFRARAGDAVHGKWLADLPALARLRLRAAGVPSVHGNDGSAAWCTVANASRFFSYRRDGVCGRMAASVWRV
ncbi:peptidoglycan editing factor PgeF [Pseudorhodoferax sp.]|uniref:peptidoglycan editing factor PgeF n=1 Tax=Pseudorhodoferax sp. TaxID=1993553 RepID=UPI0039E425ED